MSLTWPVTPLTGSIHSEWYSCDAEFHPGSDYFHAQIRAFWGCQHDWHFHSWGQGSSMSQQARGQPVSSGTSVCSCSWVQRIPSHPSWLPVFYISKFTNLSDLNQAFHCEWLFGNPDSEPTFSKFFQACLGRCMPRPVRARAVWLLVKQQKYTCGPSWRWKQNFFLSSL